MLTFFWPICGHMEKREGTDLEREAEERERLLGFARDHTLNGDRVRLTEAQIRGVVQHR